MAAHLDSARRLPTRTLAAIAVGVVLMVGLAACGDDSNGANAGSGDVTTTTTASGGDGYGRTTGGTSVEGSTVVARDFSLTSATVASGAEVTFENKGNATHTMTADDGSFDSDRVAAGSTASVTAPGEPGDYPFHCEIHSGMTGTLTAEG